MLGTKVWGGTAASINGWHRPADDRTQQIHGWHKQMNPATQCNVNHHKQQQTSNSLWNWLDQVNLRQLLIEYDIFCQKPLLALKISLRNFFTTLLEGTRLLDFSVHYPTLPYSKLKNHYSLGPVFQTFNDFQNQINWVGRSTTGKFYFSCHYHRLEYTLRRQVLRGHTSVIYSCVECL